MKNMVSFIFMALIFTAIAIAMGEMFF